MMKTEVKKKSKKIEKTKIEVQVETEIEKPDNILTKISKRFGFKVINLRKDAYPTLNPEMSDYHKFKVGDLIARSTYYGATRASTIYEVMEIRRQAIEKDELDGLERKWGRDSTILELISEYRKNGNFGACKIFMKCIFRANKIVNKGRTTSFTEVSLKRGHFREYSKVDLGIIQSHRSYDMQRYQSRVISLQNKIKSLSEANKNIIKLISMRTSKTEEKEAA